MIVLREEQCLTIPDTEPKVANPSTPALLLSLATSRTYKPDLEDFTGLCTVALAYLTYEQFQTELVESNSFSVLQQAFYDSYTNFDIAHADPDVAEQLKQVWNAFVTIYADISSLATFAAKYPIGSPEVQRLITWLSSPPSYSHLQTAACLSLGNLSRSDTTSLALATQVKDTLLAILSHAVPSPDVTLPSSERPPAQLLHAVLGFLKNLAIPATNKPILSAGLLSKEENTLPRLWTSTTAQPQVQFAAISLSRLLLVNNPPAVKQLCTPLSGQDDGYKARDGPARSNLHVLMDVAFRADAEPTKMEAGRAVCGVIRTLQNTEGVLDNSWTWTRITDTDTVTVSTYGDVGGDISARARFYTTHALPISKTLGELLTQNKFPALRSEALFVLALMGRSTDAGRVAIQVLEPVEACKVLVKAVLGREVSDEELGERQGSVSAIEERQAGQVRGTSVNIGLIDGLGLEPQGDAKPKIGRAHV